MALTIQKPNNGTIEWGNFMKSSDVTNWLHLQISSTYLFKFHETDMMRIGNLHLICLVSKVTLPNENVCLKSNTLPMT